MFEIRFHNTSTETTSKVTAFVEEWENDSKSFNTSTSGSTGIPKAIQIRKEFAENSAKMTHDFLGLKPESHALLCLPISSIAGKMMVIRSIVNNYILHVVEPSSQPLSELDNINFDFAAFVPMQVEQTLKSNPAKFQSVRTVIIGGATINHNLWDQIASSHKQAFQTFGMTETISHIAMRKISSERLPYQILDGVRIEESDELILDVPMLGVQSLATNDLIQWIDEKHFEWLGRKDSVINSGGFKIHPERIEEKLGGLVHQNYFSIGLKDEKLGERHALAIEGEQEIHKKDLITLLDRKEVPKELYFFEKFDYTHSNKIDRIKTIARIKDAHKKVL